MRIAAVASAMPEHRFAQQDITAALKDYWGEKLKSPELLERFHSRLGVDHRYLAYPFDRYSRFASWGEANSAWLSAAVELGERAINEALDQAGIGRDELNALFVVSITGIAYAPGQCRRRTVPIARGLVRQRSRGAPLSNSTAEDRQSCSRGNPADGPVRRRAMPGDRRR